MFQRILIACVGNICRSPMGAALLQRDLGNSHPEVVVESAGISALIGHAADPIAQTLLSEQGLDLSAHRARQLSATMVLEFDLILTMETGHVKAIEKIAPGAKGRVYRLGKWGDYDIPDPYRKPRQAFEEVLELLEESLNEWQQRIFPRHHE